MIKKITTSLIILALSTQVTAFAKQSKERTIPGDQNIKVRAINLIGGVIHSQEKLEKILLEEQGKGWTYNYHVDIDNPETGYITKLFVFKRDLNGKISNK